MSFKDTNLKKFKQVGKENVLHKLIADPRVTSDENNVRELISLIHVRCDRDDEMIRMKDENKETPLHTAARYNCETAAKIFIDK